MGQAFINGHVLDGTLNEDGRMVAHDWTVIVSGSKISAMGPASEVDTQGHEVIDLGAPLSPTTTCGGGLCTSPATAA